METNCPYCEGILEGEVCPRCRDERRGIAHKLAGLLRDLADATEKAAEGDKASRELLADHIDGYWGALVVGKNVGELVNHREEV